MIDLSSILLDNHLPSFRAISGAVTFYGSRLDSGFWFGFLLNLGFWQRVTSSYQVTIA